MESLAKQKFAGKGEGDGLWLREAVGKALGRIEVYNVERMETYSDDVEEQEDD